MIVFWVIAGVMIAGALLFILPPLLGRRALSGGASHGQANVSIYKDQLRELERDLAQGVIGKEHYEAARSEIERRALDESTDAVTAPAPAQAQWTLVTAIGVALPALAIVLYLTVGTPAALAPGATAAQKDEGHAITPERIQAMVAGLAQRLKENPEDPEGWAMLAKSYNALGRYPEAASAYAEAARRIPNDAQLLADYADTLAMAQGRSLQGEPEKLIAQALTADPNNVKALALAGTVAYSKKEYAQAATLWRRVLAIIPPESDMARRMQASVTEAESFAQGGGGLSVVDKPARSSGQAGAAVSGKVSLSPEALRSVAGTDTVFVFARAADGSRMPVAIFRTRVDALPAEFRLDDSMSMVADRRLSQVGDLLLGARVSRSGSATPGAGDWESDLVAARLGAKNVSLVVGRQREK